MPAIITDNFRRNNTRLFLTDVQTNPPAPGNGYYLGIGKLDVWSADETSPQFVTPTPLGTRADELEVLKYKISRRLK